MTYACCKVFISGDGVFEGGAFDVSTKSGLLPQILNLIFQGLVRMEVSPPVSASPSFGSDAVGPPAMMGPHLARQIVLLCAATNIPRNKILLYRVTAVLLLSFWAALLTFDSIDKLLFRIGSIYLSPTCLRRCGHACRRSVRYRG